MTRRAFIRLIVWSSASQFSWVIELYYISGPYLHYLMCFAMTKPPSYYVITSWLFKKLWETFKKVFFVDDSCYVFTECFEIFSGLFSTSLVKNIYTPWHDSLFHFVAVVIGWQTMCINVVWLFSELLLVDILPIVFTLDDKLTNHICCY